MPLRRATSPGCRCSPRNGRMTVNSNWLSRWLIPAAVLGMEAAWVVPLVALSLNGLAARAAWFTPAMSLAVFALAGLGARAIAEVVPNERAARAMTGALAAATTLLGIWAAFFPSESLLDGRWLLTLGAAALSLFVDAPSIAGTLIVCIFLWLRGLRLANGTLTFDGVFGRFRLGMVLLVVYHVLGLILVSTPLVQLVTSNLAPNVAVFFFCGLLALALSRTEEERSASPGRGVGFNRQWGLVLMLALVGELLLVLLFSALLAPETMAFITAPLAFAGGIVLQVVLWFIIAISYLAEAIITALFCLLAQFGITPQPIQLETATAPEFPEEERDPDQQPTIPELVLMAARGGLMSLLAVIALLLLWRTLRPRRPRAAATSDETRDSVWSWEAAKRELAAALRALMARLRCRGARAVASLAGLAAGVLDTDDLTSVRGVYRALLRAAGPAGIPHAAEQTAGEFQAAVAQRAPAGAHDAATVTAAYEQARYGPADALRADLPAVVAAWRRVQDALGDGGPSAG
ncbi:MAG: DUF4129 domain-containing protein [Dehalococcoidia bacterium]|nr:DUF4129 domain-containing protein [Dehalococcoidia bacterium]